MRASPANRGGLRCACHPPLPPSPPDGWLLIPPTFPLPRPPAHLHPPAPQVLLVPPALASAALLPLLEPYQRRYRVWRLSFAGVGSTARAYRGFSTQAEAAELDKRMDHITTTWCCR